MKLKELIKALQQMDGELDAEVRIDIHSKNIDPEFKFSITHRVISIVIKESKKYKSQSSF